MLASAFEGYVPLGIMALICLTIGSVALLLSKILGPSRPTRVKQMPYECGMEPIQSTARERYSIHFYLVAILFILFDLEIAFLFPWAIVLREIGLFGFLAMAVFLAILVVGFIYEWKKGALEWD